MYNLYSNNRNDVIGVLQENPIELCFHRFPCYSPTCSVESRDRWARRERACLSWRLMQARKGISYYEGKRRHIYRDTDIGEFMRCGNASFDTFDPEVITNQITSFNRSLKHRRIKWHYVMECGRKVHIHFVLISPEQIKEKEIKPLWSNAERFYLAEIKGIAKYARYMTGDCKEKKKKKPHLFSKNWGIRNLTGGSKDFYQQGGVEACYKEIAKYSHALGIAMHDEYIHLHPTIEHYYALANAEYQKAKDFGETKTIELMEKYRNINNHGKKPDEDMGIDISDLKVHPIPILTNVENPMNNIYKVERHQPLNLITISKTETPPKICPISSSSPLIDSKCIHPTAKNEFD
jgi:hypothetical protein